MSCSDSAVKRHKPLTAHISYNPYTEPSMEIFSYHKGLNKLIEIGNSGIFRPEMLEVCVQHRRLLERGGETNRRLGYGSSQGYEGVRFRFEFGEADYDQIWHFEHSRVARPSSRSQLHPEEPGGPVGQKLDRRRGTGKTSVRQTGIFPSCLIAQQTADGSRSLDPRRLTEGQELVSAHDELSCASSLAQRASQTKLFRGA